MILLLDKATGAELAEISEDELRFLVDEFEEESPDDRDYFIDHVTFEVLEQHGASEHLLQVLGQALDERSEMDVEWLDTEDPDRPPPGDEANG